LPKALSRGLCLHRLKQKIEERRGRTIISSEKAMKKRASILHKWHPYILYLLQVRHRAEERQRPKRFLTGIGFTHRILLSISYLPNASVDKLALI
jgi:hypothetical protein